jgi:hypothetical protein
VTTTAAPHHDATAMPEGLTFDAKSPAYVAIRAVLFLGLLIAIGAMAFEGGFSNAGDSPTR